MKEKKSRKPSAARIVLALCCLVLLCVSGYKVAADVIRGQREQQAFDDLLAELEPDPVEEAPSQEQSNFVPDEEDPYQPDPPQPMVTRPNGDLMLWRYAELYDKNNDLFGWVSIPGTVLNYPVMHTPDDPEYYIHRAFDGSYSHSGVPFLDGACYEGCGNYIVYGHDMKNGTMFASLLKYRDKSFWEEHPVIRFDTVEERAKYEVMAAFYSRVYAQSEEGVFRYYYYQDLTDPEVFDEYVEQVKQSARYSTGVDAVYGDQLLTLTTCSYQTTEGRFVVVARKLRTETEPEGETGQEAESSGAEPSM